MNASFSDCSPESQFLVKNFVPLRALSLLASFWFKYLCLNVSRKDFLVSALLPSEPKTTFCKSDLLVTGWHAMIVADVLDEWLDFANILLNLFPLTWLPYEVLPSNPQQGHKKLGDLNPSSKVFT